MSRDGERDDEKKTEGDETTPVKNRSRIYRGQVMYEKAFYVH